eukprot:m.71410 g.71410  ORF g.71410 m.71410 type:complete len:577 (-) comp10067_c0_seq1:114-1844(-)
MAYDAEALWDAPNELDPFADDSAENPLYQTPPTAPPKPRRTTPKPGTKVESVDRLDVISGTAALAPHLDPTKTLPKWHADPVPGVPMHAATGAAGKYAAASVTRSSSSQKGVPDSAGLPPRPKGVAQHEWDRYLAVIHRTQTKKGKSLKSQSAGSAGSSAVEVSPSTRPAKDSVETVMSAKPVGTSDAEWARYLSKVAEAKRQSHLAPAMQTYIKVSTTVEEGPQQAVKTVAEKATDLGATPLAAIREFQARERGKMLKNAAGGSPTTSPKASPVSERKRPSRSRRKKPPAERPTDDISADAIFSKSPESGEEVKNTKCEREPKVPVYDNPFAPPDEPATPNDSTEAVVVEPKLQPAELPAEEVTPTKVRKSWSRRKKQADQLSNDSVTADAIFSKSPEGAELTVPASAATYGPIDDNPFAPPKEPEIVAPSKQAEPANLTASKDTLLTEAARTSDAVAHSPKQSPRSSARNSRRKGSPKVTRVPLLNAEGHDDDWVFGAGLRQDHKTRPKAEETSIFPSVAPPPEEKKPEPVRTIEDDPDWQARVAEAELRNRGGLHHNPDSDDDDLFGGAVGVI